MGPALFLLAALAPTPDGLTPEGQRAGALALLMATWWITEPIPVAATALLPLALAPALGILPMAETAAPYANPVIYLFLGGFLLALGMESSDLHRRIALQTARRVGTSPRAIIGGFMLSTAVLSMWVSNTATVLMMVPMGLSILALASREGSGLSERDRSNLGKGLMIGLAHAATVGGLGTLIGTPPNALMAGYLQEAHGIEVGFLQWMLVGVPLVIVGLPLVWWVLTRLVFPVEASDLPGGRDLVTRELDRMGRMSPAQRRVGVVFGLVAASWMARPFLPEAWAWTSGLSDAGIAIVGALALFLLPAGAARGPRILSWDDAQRVPWGVLVLFGGGLSLAAAMTATGLDVWVGGLLGGLAGWPLALVMLVVVVAIIFLSEVMSNTAAAATFLPVAGALAVGLGVGPLVLIVPAALAATTAFMMPVGTPPNAIAYGTGAFEVADMARAGVLLNVAFAVLVTVVGLTLVPLVLG